jgi:hypothetical protein
MRRASSGNIAAVLIAVAIVLTSCEQNTVHNGAAAARSRAQVVAAARQLYQTLYEASPQAVDLFDSGYQLCGNGSTMLSYNVSLRLFAFADTQNTDFDAFQHQAVGLVRSVGWTLRPQPLTRSEALPTVPSAFYGLSKRAGRSGLSGRLALVGDVNPLVGVTGTLAVNGPCFDADGSAGRLESQPASPPFPLPSPPHP